MEKISTPIREFKAYQGGSNQTEIEICKERDDYFIFWSQEEFLGYFIDGINPPRY